MSGLEEEIVEDRTWRNGIEIVSHINWSQVARVRRSLGLAGGAIFEVPWNLSSRATTSVDPRRRSPRPRVSTKLRLVADDRELMRASA
jgi:hypothetical protein